MWAASSILVGGTPTLIANPSTGSISDPIPIVVFNNDGTNTLFLGGPTVSSATGIPILKQTGISFRCIVSDPLFAVAGAGSIDCRVMLGRQ